MDTSDLPATEEKEEEKENSREEASLQWVKELHVLPMEHEVVVAEPSSDQPDYNPSSHDIDYILGNLEVHMTLYNYDIQCYPSQVYWFLSLNTVCILLYTIMSCTLQSVLGQLTIQSQKVKRSIANINFVMNTVSMEMATELKERLTWIKQHWEPLAGRVRHRIAQMKFEKAQKVM